MSPQPNRQPFNGVSPNWAVVVDVFPRTNDFLSDWKKMRDLCWYLDVCEMRGLLIAENEARQFAVRWLAGKRKHSKPGSERAKKAAHQRRRFMRNVPADVWQAIDDVLANNPKAVADYAAGKEKAVGALIGQLVKRCKIPADAAAILIKDKLKPA